MYFHTEGLFIFSRMKSLPLVSIKSCLTASFRLKLWNADKENGGGGAPTLFPSSCEGIYIKFLFPDVTLHIPSTLHRPPLLWYNQSAYTLIHGCHPQFLILVIILYIHLIILLSSLFRSCFHPFILLTRSAGQFGWTSSFALSRCEGNIYSWLIL